MFSLHCMCGCLLIELIGCRIRSNRVSLLSAIKTMAMSIRFEWLRVPGTSVGLLRFIFTSFWFIWIWVYFFFNFGSNAALELADIDWDNLGFGFMPTDYMYTMKCSQEEAFSKGELQRFGNIELSPSSGILNYGQVSFGIQLFNFNIPLRNIFSSLICGNA